MVVSVVAQLEFQLVHPAEYFGMELLHQGRIAREPSRIEALHRALQILDFLERRRIVLRQMVKLVQLRQPLPVGSLRISRHRRIVRGGRTPRAIEVVVAGVDVVVGCASRSTP